MTFFVDAD